MKKYLTAATVAVTVAAAVVTAGCGSDSESSDQVLRIAMGSPGEAQIRVWRDVAKQYEKAHDGWTVELNFQDDDLYETIGLQNLLNGRQAPDIYFEWAGGRLQTRYDDGFAADLSDYVTDGPLAGLLPESAYNHATIDDKIVMVPFSEDVTNVLWYNKDILDANNIAPPKTFDELLAACDTLHEKDIIPIASGNKDLWAAGNWLAHMVSRVVGEDSYDAVMSGDEQFDNPDWVSALDTVSQLHEHHCVNPDVNALADNEGAQLFFQGKAAMHMIGSWLVSWAIDEAPDLDFDFVNLPAMPDGAGDQDSVIGVVTGYVVNAKSSKKDQAAAFLALLNSKDNVAAFIDADTVPLAKSASEGQDIDDRTERLYTMLEGASTVVHPPDTGYDLKRADALYSALAEVLGGVATPDEALAKADNKLQ